MHCRRLINHHGNLVLRRTLKCLEHIDYCWLKNRWRKLVLRIWTFADWETVEENGVLAVPQISSKPSSTADAEIFNGHSLLVAQKPLMKTSSLGPKNHPKTIQKHSSTADNDKFCAHGLLLIEKALTKTDSLLSQKYPRNPVLRLTLKSSMDIDYCWLKNRWQKLCPCGQKIHKKKPSSTADVDMFSTYRLLLTEKALM
jgi:hypothetical protein